MSKVVCASALMLPLALPVAAQAQTSPPVTMAAAPSTEYQQTYVQATPALEYNTCLQTNTEYSFTLNADVQLGGAYTAPWSWRGYNAGYTVGFAPTTVSGSGPASFSTTVSFRTPTTPTEERYNFFIDLQGISRIPTGEGTPPADETSFVVLVPCLTAAQQSPSPSASTAPVADNTISFKLTVTGTPCDNATYWGLVAIYASDGFVYTQLTDPDADGVYTGTAPTFYDGAKLIVRLEQGTGVGQSSPLPGGTPVPIPGEPSRVIADFGTQEQDGLKYIVLNGDFTAEASVDGCAAAPSATPVPSATAKPSATGKPSVAASATPAPSSAPSKLPDTGAADTLLSGLLAAGAALAASGAYLLRRRAR
jgi:LPXTG-motif cell wall-anchored protein